MTIPDVKKVYPRIGDKEIVYLKNVINNANIEVGDFTIYNDFVHDPRDFQKNNVLYHYPINKDKLIIGKFCSIVGGVPARPIRKRFSDENINTLLSLKWWDWPVEKIAANMEFIQSGNLDALKASS